MKIRRDQNLITKPPKNPAAKVKKDSTKAKAGKRKDLSDGKSYEDFSSIMDGYGDLLKDLLPENPDCEVDKVVKFILDKNILIRNINVALSHFSVCKGQFYKKSKGSITS